MENQLIEAVVDGILFYALLFFVVATILSGGMWAVGAFSTNYTQSTNGKKGFLISSGAALAISAFSVIVGFALKVGWFGRLLDSPALLVLLIVAAGTLGAYKLVRLLRSTRIRLPYLALGELLVLLATAIIIPPRRRNHWLLAAQSYIYEAPRGHRRRWCLHLVLKAPGYSIAAGLPMVSEQVAELSEHVSNLREDPSQLRESFLKAVDRVIFSASCRVALLFSPLIFLPSSIWSSRTATSIGTLAGFALIQVILQGATTCLRHLRRRAAADKDANN